MEENQPASPTVMSVSLKFGVIMATVGIVTFMIKIAVGSNPFDNDWVGWLSLVIAIGLVVLAHKSFKDGGDGYMSYGQGFGIGTLSMLISMVISVLFSFFYTSFIDQGLMEEFWQITEQNMREKGQNEEAITVAMEWTKKLFWVFYIVGAGFMAVICGLVVSIFTQRKNAEALS